MGKISGPLMDRIDIVARVAVEDYEKLTKRCSKEETSAQIRARVNRARSIQLERYKKIKACCNSELTARQVEQFCELDEDGYSLMKNAFDAYGLSARSYHRILKLARTIADLEGKEKISSMHLAESLQYRFSER